MEIYWLVAVAMVLIQLIPSKNQNAKLAFTLLPLFIYGALRLDFGNDYEAYNTLYYQIKATGEGTERTELGYVLLNMLCPSFRTLLVILTGFTCVTIFCFIKEFVSKKYYLLFVLLLILAGDKTIFFQFSCLRNAIAINIFIFATIVVIRQYKHCYLWYFALMLLATTFHTTSILFFPLAFLFITQKKITKNWGVIIVLTTVIIIILVNYSTVLLNVVTAVVNDHFEKYADYTDNANMLKGAGILSIAFNFIAVALYVYVVVNYPMDNKSYLLMKLGIVAVISLSLGPLAMRMSQCYILFFILQPLLIKNNKYVPAQIRSVSMIITVAYLAYAFFIVFLNNPYFTYQTYKSILQ